jgi:carbon starvation protein
VLLVAGWGYFLIQGVRDPLGGVYSLWPLFGIANQMLAAIGLCLGTTIILKMALQRGPGVDGRGPAGKPAFALVTLVPLVWLLAVTMTAGVQKVLHPDPRIGFLAQANVLSAELPKLEQALTSAKAAGGGAALEQAEQALHKNRALHFNNCLDAVVAAAFLVLLTSILVLSVWEWVLLLSRRKPAVLRETEPVWLPEEALAAGRPWRMAGVAALTIALTKELSGEAEMERSSHAASLCECEHGPACGSAALSAAQAHKAGAHAYVEMAERRFKGVRNCC